MAFNTKIKLDNSRVEQASNATLTLSGHTQIGGNLDIRYTSHPNFTGDTQLVDKKYVDDVVLTGTTAATTYNLASPATVTVGGVFSGTVLTGKTSNEILAEILTPYQLPEFSAFGSEMSSNVEVGTVLSGVKQFNWSFNNGSNVDANTMCIIDVTSGNTLIATNISITSPQSTNIGTKTFTSCGQTQQWKGCAENTCSASFGSSLTTVTSLLPYYYGKCTCPGAAGENRPTLTPAQITGGTKVLSGSAGSLSITFSSTDNDYLWFAVPASVSDKVCWYVDGLNNGAIGGGISPACNLFPTSTLVSGVQSVCWSGQSYDLYVSNKQTAQSLSMTIS